MNLCENKIRSKNTLVLVMLMITVAIVAVPAWAFVREGSIPGRSGLSFQRVTYYWDHLEVNIRNSTKQNVLFGGTMIFTDRHGRPVARAELLPEKIKRSSSRRYKAYFSFGSGEEASAAWGLTWDLNQRNN